MSEMLEPFLVSPTNKLRLDPHEDRTSFNVHITSATVVFVVESHSSFKIRTLPKKKKRKSCDMVRLIHLVSTTTESFLR